MVITDRKLCGVCLDYPGIIIQMISFVDEVLEDDEGVKTLPVLEDYR